jgi:hypothetical protein
LFSKFCVPFFNKMVNMPDYKVATMQNLLQNVFDNAEGAAMGVGHTDFWVKGGTASGLNSGALSKINSEMVRALVSSAGTQLEKDL